MGYHKPEMLKLPVFREFSFTYNLQKNSAVVGIDIKMVISKMYRKIQCTLKFGSHGNHR